MECFFCQSDWCTCTVEAINADTARILAARYQGGASCDWQAMVL